MSLLVKFRSHKRSRQMPLTSSPVSIHSVKEYIYEHWMGSSLRCKNTKYCPDTVMAVDNEGNELPDDTMVDMDATVQVRRVPGSCYRVYAGCKTEDEKIAAWIQHAEWAWKKSYKEVRSRNMELNDQGCFSYSKAALDIQPAVLRRGLLWVEDRAMLGIGGILVMYNTITGSVL